jgi:hypothetical protein
MLRRLSPITSSAGRAVVVLLTFEVAAVSALRYFTGSEPPPPPILANAFAKPFLLLHVAGGVTALLVAPLQFAQRIRTRRPSLHRLAGRAYLVGCAIGAPAGLMLALGTTAGAVARVGFAMPAVLWAAFTWLGRRAAVDRRFAAHRDWMIRSYALTSTAITLRLMLPASALLGFDFLPAYRAISWLAWITNLALFEYMIRRTRSPRAIQTALATA